MNPVCLAVKIAVPTKHESKLGFFDQGLQPGFWASVPDMSSNIAGVLGFVRFWIDAAQHSHEPLAF